MEAVNLILNFVIVLILIALFLWQKNKLDSLEKLNAAMERYSNIFKIDEVEKYVDMNRKSAYMEAEEKANEKIKYLLEKLNKGVLLKESDESIKDLKNFFKSLLESTLGPLLGFLNEMDKESRDKFIEENIHNEIIKTALVEAFKDNK